MAPYRFVSSSVAVGSEFQTTSSLNDTPIVVSFPLDSLSGVDSGGWSGSWSSYKYERDADAYPCRCTYGKHCAKMALEIPLRPSFDFSQYADALSGLDNMVQSNVARWNICHLLSLPKELRLEIWKYALTDPSVDVAVHIIRGASSPQRMRVRTYLDPKHSSSINPALLRVNKFVHDEAIPILYNSIKFNPLHLEGIFPLFLSSLPSYGPSLIRHVQLRIPAEVADIQLFGDPSTVLVNWAITCAQIAKLEALKDVEVVGFSPDLATERVSRGIMNPLCKIKVKKIFTGEYKEDAENMLAAAESRLKDQAAMREAGTKAEARERAIRDEQLRQVEMKREEERNHVYPFPFTDESTIEEDISHLPGIRAFEKALQEHAATAPSRSTTPTIPTYDDTETEIGDWDLISLRSAASTPKAQGQSQSQPRLQDSDAVPEYSEASSPTASTLVDLEEHRKPQDDDASSERWEQVVPYLQQ